MLLARARDPEAATAVALVVAIVAFAPVTALTFDADRDVWPFTIGTGALQLLYFILLATAYRKSRCRWSTRSRAGSRRCSSCSRASRC